jgi:hypothetical protein
MQHPIGGLGARDAVDVQEAKSSKMFEEEE